jgi:hypothetical protein
MSTAVSSSSGSPAASSGSEQQQVRQLGPLPLANCDAERLLYLAEREAASPLISYRLRTKSSNDGASCADASSRVSLWHKPKVKP